MTPRITDVFRRKPLVVFFAAVVLVSFFAHFGNRASHFQECDSDLVYDALYNFPRSALSFSAVSAPGKGFLSESAARKILDYPLVERLVGGYAKDANDLALAKEEIVDRLAGMSPPALLRLGEIGAVSVAPLPHPIRSFFALPLSSTYSPGAGFMYGIISGAKTAYDDFMSRGTALTLLLFHLGALFLFLALLAGGANKYAAFTVSLLALFSVSLYSYGYHLGSTVWNFASGAVWLWFLGRWAKDPRLLWRMSQVTGISVFFNYLIVFYWAALLFAVFFPRLKENKWAGAKDALREFWKTQKAALFGIAIVAALFLPVSPVRSGVPDAYSLGGVAESFYYIILNFFSFYTPNAFFNYLQFFAGLILVFCGAWGVLRKGKDGAAVPDVPARTAAGVFPLFFAVVLVGILGFWPTRHILFLAPALFFMIAAGISRILAGRNIRLAYFLPVVAAVIIFGFAAVNFRMGETRDAWEGGAAPQGASAVIVEDCSFNLVYKDWGTDLPVVQANPRTMREFLKAGETYFYASQTTTFEEALGRWGYEGVEKLSVGDEFSGAYFTAYNPNRLGFTRPNGKHWAIFRVLKRDEALP